MKCPVEVPPKFLLGNDRNAQRIRRLMAFIEVQPRGKKIDNYVDELKRRINPKPNKKPGVVVNVGLARK